MPGDSLVSEDAWRHLRALHDAGVSSARVAALVGCSESMVRSVRIGLRVASPELARRILHVEACDIEDRVPGRYRRQDRWAEERRSARVMVVERMSDEARALVVELEAEPVVVFAPELIEGAECTRCGGPLRRVDVPHWLRDTETARRVGGWCDECRRGWIVTFSVARHGGVSPPYYKAFDAWWVERLRQGRVVL